MAGLYSRANYDSCAYNSAIKQSTGPLSYMLNNFGILPTNIKNQGVSTNYNSHAINTFKCDNGEKSTIEHQLQGINRIKTKCPEKQFPNQDKLCIKNNFTESKFTEESSRLTNPLYNYRGMTINRFINLGVRPPAICQNYAENTVLNAKDSYKAAR